MDYYSSRGASPEAVRLQAEREALLQKQARLKKQLGSARSASAQVYQQYNTHHDHARSITPPRRAQLQAQRGGLQDELKVLEAELGQLLTHENDANRHPLQGFKTEGGRGGGGDTQRCHVPLRPDEPLGLEYEDTSSGVMITGLTNWGTARHSGLSRGAVIAAVGGERVGCGADLRDALLRAREACFGSVSFDIIARRGVDLSPTAITSTTQPQRHPLQQVAPNIVANKPTKLTESYLRWPDWKEVQSQKAIPPSAGRISPPRMPPPPPPPGVGIGVGPMLLEEIANLNVSPETSPSPPPKAGMMNLNANTQSLGEGGKDLTAVLSDLHATQQLLLQKAAAFEAEIGNMKRRQTETTTSTPTPTIHPGGLRFAIGDTVACNLGGAWSNGVVIETNWRGRTWPQERLSVPYQIRIEGTGQLVFAPLDDDRVVRGAADDKSVSRAPSPPPPPAGPTANPKRSLVYSKGRPAAPKTTAEGGTMNTWA